VHATAIRIIDPAFFMIQRKIRYSRCDLASTLQAEIHQDDQERGLDKDNLGYRRNLRVAYCMDEQALERAWSGH